MNVPGVLWYTALALEVWSFVAQSVPVLVVALVCISAAVVAEIVTAGSGTAAATPAPPTEPRPK